MTPRRAKNPRSWGLLALVSMASLFAPGCGSDGRTYLPEANARRHLAQSGAGASAAPVEAPRPSGATPEFQRVRDILTRKCKECHAAFPRYGEQDWVRSLYIVPGAPRSSRLFARLKGSAAGGQQDMPLEGELTADELGAFATWIERVPRPAGASHRPTARQRTEAALSVLKLACASCHETEKRGKSADYRGTAVPAFGKFDTDNDFVVSGLVSPKNVGESWLFRSLDEWGDIATMPKGNEPLHEAQKDVLRDWIEGIGEP